MLLISAIRENHEEIVQKMEAGELTLDDSLKLFEEGVKLSRECNKELSTAEQKVKKLVGVDAQGEPILENFDNN